MSKDTHRYYEVVVEFDRKHPKTGMIEIGEEREYVLCEKSVKAAEKEAKLLLNESEGKNLINKNKIKAKAVVSKKQDRR